MLGFAQNLYLQKQGKSFSKYDSVVKAPWPFLNHILRESKIEYVDYFFAEVVLRPYNFENEQLAVLLAFLSYAARRGHLCLTINEKEIRGNCKTTVPQKIDDFAANSESQHADSCCVDGGLPGWAGEEKRPELTAKGRFYGVHELYNCLIIPSPMQLWPKADIDQSNEEKNLSLKISHMILEASQNLPDWLSTHVKNIKTRVLTPLCRYEESIYLQRFWQDKASIIQNIRRLKGSMTFSFDEKEVGQIVEQFKIERKLTEEQATSFLTILNSNISILSGGPGTGKTYLVELLIQAYLQLFPDHSRQTCEIALAAPTGKAAAHLQKCLLRVTEEFKEVNICAQTLHAWLQVTPNKVTRSNKLLSANFLIVDECSMIDLRLMALLLEAVQEGTKVLFIGDKNQLSPVELGAPFSELIQEADLPICHLTHCLRSESRAIVQLAEKIQTENSETVLSILQHSNEVKYFPIGDIKKIVDYASQLYPTLTYDELTPNRLFHASKHFGMLSPVRQGPYGVEVLNQLMFKKLYSQAKDWIIIPIIITQNDRRLEIYNGDAGFLVHRIKESSEDFAVDKTDFVLFTKDEETCRQIPACTLPKYEYGWCLSVHKSQGSEYDNLLVILPEGSEIFGRRMFYTAVTRARKNLEIYSTDNMILKIMQNPF